MRWLIVLLAVLVSSSHANTSANSNIILWPNANSAPAWATVDSQSTGPAVNAGIRFDASVLGGLQVSISQPGSHHLALPDGVEQLSLVVDSPDTHALKTCQHQSSCAASLGGAAAVQQATQGPAVWLRVQFAEHAQFQARRQAEKALCHFLSDVIDPSTGFHASSACQIPATVEPSAENTAAAALSLWERHNLTSPSLLLPHSKLASVSSELVPFLWPEFNQKAELAIDPIKLTSNLDTSHRVKFMRYSLQPSSFATSTLFKADAASSNPIFSMLAALQNQIPGLPSLGSVRGVLEISAVGVTAKSIQVVLQPVASSFVLLKAAQFQSKLVSQVELVAVSESSASQPRGSGLSVKFDQNSQPEIRLQLELRPVRFMSDVGNTVPVTHCRGSLNRVLSKTGFHRNLLTNLNIAESDQCVIAPSAPFCWLWSLENVPDSMYIDPFEIQELERFGGPESVVYGNVDIEKPWSLAAQDTASTLYRGKNMMTWQRLNNGVSIDVQVHLRYHTPSQHSMVNVTIPSPHLFVKCAAQPDTATLAKLPWNRLILLESDTAMHHQFESIVAQVPVGILSHDSPVLIATFACTCIAVAVMLYRLIILDRRPKQA